jgi:two-component system response regulator VanR
LSFANITLDPQKFIVTLDDEEISLTKNEFDILKKLMEQNGNIVKRETLMTDVIGYENYAFDRTIDTHIKNLRKKLQNKDIIMTIR